MVKITIIFILRSESRRWWRTNKVKRERETGETRREMKRFAVDVKKGLN